MESATIERVFGGIAYLLGASSKYDFFSRLEAFLADLYGPIRFTIILPHDRGRLRAEHSNLPGFPDGKEEPVPVGGAELPVILRDGRDFLPGPGTGPAVAGIEGREVPLHAARALSGGGRSFGWVAFHDPPLLAPDGPDGLGIEDFCFDQISSAYGMVDERERLERRLELSEAKLDAFNRIGELIASLDVDVLLTKLLELSLFVTTAQVGSVVLIAGEGIESRIEWGLPLSVVRGLRREDGRPILDEVLGSGRPELLRNFREMGMCDGSESFRVESFLCVPLATKTEILGAINLINSSGPSSFGPEDRESILTISGLAATAVENALLHRDSLEKERITETLRIARSIQKRMEPKERPRIPGFDTAWVSRSCDETGGDYFDFIPLQRGGCIAAIGDVSGHGIGAALLMATGRASLRALFSVEMGIREAVEALDALMERDMDPEKFMTLFVGQIDASGNELRYVNAGHDAPLLFSKRLGTVTELKATGMPLGILGRSSRHVDPGPLSLEAGDVLLLSTDGVWEGANPRGERFGKGRLADLFRRVAAGSALEIVEAIGGEVAAFTESAVQKDDFTMVAIKRTGAIGYDGYDGYDGHHSPGC